MSKVSQTSPTNQQVIELVKSEVEILKDSNTPNSTLTHKEGETIRSNAWGYKEWADS
jgi:hypothetical protein